MTVIPVTKRSIPKHRLLFPAILFIIVLALLGVLLFNITYCPTKDTVILEAGSVCPSPNDFFEKASASEIRYAESTETMLQSGILSVPGTYPVSLLLDGKERTSTLTVTDTVAPVAEVIPETLYNPSVIPDADMFLTNITDVTEVQVAYHNSLPDITLPGTQDVSILLTDTSGNETIFTTTLTVVHDTEGPIISGVTKLEAYVGTAVSYRSGISVTDNTDPTPALEIDNSNVDLSTPGDYEVIYTATDAAGNSTSVSTNIHVYEKKEDFVEPEVIYETIDGLLSRIIRDDMTDREKVEACYCWVIMHSQYYNHSDKSDWLQEAYRLYKNRRGDCFSYYALWRLMLQRLDIPFIDVYKVKNHPADSSHYWLLVSVDRGENYYHVDGVWDMNLCLVTDEVLDYFSYQHNNCFNRDKSLYPATPTEPLPYHELPYFDPVLRETRS